MALQGFVAQIKVQSSGVAMTDEATSSSDNLSYQITNSSKRILDLNTAIVVEDDGIPTTENYTIDYLNGTITFAETDTRTITVTGAYMTPTTVATAMSYTASVTNEVQENTAFTSAFRTYQGGLTTGTASLERYHVSDDLFIDEVLAGNYLIIELFVDDTNKASFYGLINSDSINAEVSALITESIDIQITTQIEV